MFTKENREQLKTKGYTVVKNVVSPSFCDECNTQYDDWLSKFTKTGDWPMTSNSLIQRYRVGQFEPTWRIRLACRPIFAELWGTEKLLTSIDAIAVGRPPEAGIESFDAPDKHWLHCDQAGNQKGLHGVQGALYLETSDEDDWSFIVMDGSHHKTDEFYATATPAIESSTKDHEYRSVDKEPDWFTARGCAIRRVPVTKGGMVLWDSRLVHANARPLKGRKNPGRIRRTAFVCMTPAVWATEADLTLKREAYNNLRMTKHWPSQRVMLFPDDVPNEYKNISSTDELPDVAKTDDVKRLCGVIPYDFNDGQPNGPNWEPEWIGGYSRGKNPKR